MLPLFPFNQPLCNPLVMSLAGALVVAGCATTADAPGVRAKAGDLTAALQ